MKHERRKPDTRSSLRQVGRLLVAVALLASMVSSQEAKAMHGCSAFRTTETALIMAVRAKDIGRVKALLAAGVRIDDRDEYAGRTALMWAADGGSFDIARVLLDRGAAPSLMDDEGSTALAIAGEHGDTALAHLLQQRIQHRERLDSLHRKQRVSTFRLVMRPR